MDWLDDTQLANWMRFGGLLAMLPGELDSEMQRRAGLTQFEYVTLANLSESPTRTRRISELATMTNGSLSRMSHLLKRLEGQGWVRREPDPDNGRYTNAILTDDGWAKVVETAPQQLEVVRRLVVDVLTPAQLRQLGEISARLLQHLGPGCPPS